MVAKLCDIEELHETEELLAELGDQVHGLAVTQNIKKNERDSSLLPETIMKSNEKLINQD